jgi:hypothetical protein
MLHYSDEPALGDDARANDIREVGSWRIYFEEGTTEVLPYSSASDSISIEEECNASISGKDVQVSVLFYGSGLWNFHWISLLNNISAMLLNFISGHSE